MKAAQKDKGNAKNCRHIQYESSITAQVGGSNFSALDNAKYVKICLAVY
jgi:malate/lactate dehydrogenase